MFFSLDVVRAKEGDCLLLHFGPKDDNGAPAGLMMIDGGPGGVYEPHLKRRLDQVRRGRKLDADDPLQVDLLMVSHVDDDHVVGLLDLTRQLIEEMDAQELPSVNVFSLWHNSFDDIIGNRSDELEAAFAKQFGAAATGTELPDDALKAVEDEFEGEQDESRREIVTDTMKILASIRKGFHLRLDSEKLGFPRNPEFDEKPVTASADAVSMDNGLTLTVAGPMREELEELLKAHDKWLKKLEREGKSPSAALAAYADPSVTNLSSIVALAELDGKTILLTGDARGDKIIDGLKSVGLLGQNNESTLAVDILKVPHHGSANNVEDDFFERITADHYVFSGNGKHGNPERETLEMLFRARPDADFVMHFTYPIEEIDAERQADWESHHDEPWSAETQSLGRFLKDQNVAADRIKIVEAGKPHVIDLLDEVGF